MLETVETFVVVVGVVLVVVYLLGSWDCDYFSENLKIFQGDNVQPVLVLVESSNGVDSVAMTLTRHEINDCWSFSLLLVFFPFLFSSRKSKR